METLGSLKGRVALVTGCSGGIGRATALRLARLGCCIAVHYHSSKERADDVVSEIKKIDTNLRAVTFQADLSGYDGARKLHADVVRDMGHPDILFNNSGVTNKVLGLQGDIQDISAEEFENTWRTNTGTSFLRGSMDGSYFALGTGGVIGPHYASSKSALHGLLHWIAARHAKDGITSNAVAPALIIETTMMAKPSDELKAKIPVGRFGLPDEIASIVEMLVTNSYMTNKIIVADGGWTPSAF
ncbi:hypothetical protein D9619_008631 [Psilocybe cf. subviscida]|uniref:Uncharacterized protein n=1 Tax=Psilocybe cf. subviscida TaxID=2480587 RepID=A0A8H5F0Q1_9AGAR|nr:hypothetical protein D9619_008631 [Psilocybe cf. subviscida]